MSIFLRDADAKGIFSARPAAGVNGRTYNATDTFRVYRDNGTTWDDVTPASWSLAPVTIPAPSGASSITLPFAPQFPAASWYHYNGQKKIFGLFYSITGATLTYLTSEIPQTGENHELHAS